MEKIIEKIENYNFINYLIPGILFISIFNRITGLNQDENVFVNLVQYYFTGMVLSRIGAMTISPILENMKVIEFCSYEKYLKSEKNEKMDLLQRDENQYRTYIILFLVLIIVELYYLILGDFSKIKFIIIFLFLLELFYFSYIRQTNFIVKRIKYETE